MKINQKANRQGSLHRSIISVIPASLIGIIAASCLVLIVVVTPSFQLAINQKLWQSSRLANYYMLVSETRSDGGLWRWEVFIQNSHPITITLLEAENSSLGSWLDSDHMTIEEIFRAANQFCSQRQRAILDCGLDFDPQFHYPKLIDSYEMIIIRVEKFTPCKSSSDSCKPI